MGKIDKKETNPYASAVVILNKLTQDGVLKWHSSLKSLLRSEDIVTYENINNIKEPNLEKQDSSAFYCYYKKVILKIYQGMNEMPLVGKVTVPILQIVNENGYSLWSFPYVNALKDLFNSVQFQVSGANKFIEEILTDEFLK